MNKKKLKILIAVGGTGGHVFPGCNLAEHLMENNFNVEITTDKRGVKYLKNFKNIKISKLPSSPLKNKNIVTIFLSSILILYSIIRSFIFLIFNRPEVIFGMGGYASFPICIAAAILKIKFIVYENNLIIGKANKYLLPFVKKIFVAFEEVEQIPERFNNKVYVTGNIIKKKIISYSKKNYNIKSEKKLNILVLGGSQAAMIFGEKLPNIFRQCIDEGVALKIYQHCLPYQSEQLSSFYKKNKIDYEIFNFSYNLCEYFDKTNLAITRSGSSMLAELTNASIPFISIPLPSSADNHQLKNAIYYQKKKYSFLIEEKFLDVKLQTLLKSIFEDSSILSQIKHYQGQHSDKNVYKNITQELKKIIDEKN